MRTDDIHECLPRRKAFAAPIQTGGVMVRAPKRKTIGGTVTMTARSTALTAQRH
jgi:hypothetical protein